MVILSLHETIFIFSVFILFNLIMKSLYFFSQIMIFFVVVFSFPSPSVALHLISLTYIDGVD